LGVVRLLISDKDVPKRALDRPGWIWNEALGADVMMHAGDWVETACWTH
jgi:uncharacterized protein